MRADKLVAVYGTELIGRPIHTPPNGGYPGGVATVLRLGDDPNAEDIVLIVHLPGFEDEEVGMFSYEEVSFAHMTPDEARVHFNKLMKQFDADNAAWEKQVSALPKKERFAASYGMSVEGIGPAPRSPRLCRSWALPHPHLVHEAAQYDQVWVGNYGWMDKKLWEDILCWHNEGENFEGFGEPPKKGDNSDG